MKKALIISDDHCRGTWKKLVQKYENDVDIVVQIGDMCDSFFISDSEMIFNLKEFVDYEAKCPIIKLLGNHDIPYYLSDSNINCSGHRYNISHIIRDIYNKNKEQFNLAVKFDTNTYISHAGICESWFNKFVEYLNHYSIEVNTNNIAETLNICLHERTSREVLMLINSVGRSRGGSNAVGGPLWADKTDLIKNHILGFNQVVGHTPQPLGTYRHYLDNDQSLLFCDIEEKQLDSPTFVYYDEYYL